MRQRTSAGRRVRRRAATAAAVAAVLGGAATAVAAPTRQASDTLADFTPGAAFAPLAGPLTCTGAPTGPGAEPFAIPAGYEQSVIAQETAELEDLWDMHTQNETGEDAGRFVYRTHEVGGHAPGEPTRKGAGGGLSVTDLRTGETRMLVERGDFERFDGIAWTPWGTILAAEEVTTAQHRDPSVPQAEAGLVYEFFVDPDDPMRLDPAGEPITPGDGTTDAVQDGVRARPAVGARSHEGLRFDRRGNLYGIAESRGGTEGRSGGVFRFVPDRRGDLSSGRLSALRTADGSYGRGRWIPLDRAASQVDSDKAAFAQGANRYQRPEDVETGESTGVDHNNGGQTLYVAITEGAAGGVMAVDLRGGDRPYAYPYVGPAAGNTTAEFRSADNLALDRQGNLAITEDPGGDPPAKTIGDDIWIARPPRASAARTGPYAHRAATVVARFASLKDCAAEPSGIYFTMPQTARWAAGGPLEGVLTGDTLLVHRMHSGQDAEEDQSVAIRATAGGGS